MSHSHPFLRPRGALLTAALLASLGPCTVTAQVIGKAGSVELAEPEVRRLVTALPAASRAALVADDATLEQFIRAELVRRVMLADAKAKGFDRDPVAIADLDRLREDTLVRLWIQRQSRVPDGYPAEDEVKRAYDAARERLPATSDVRLAQIFIAIPDGSMPDRVTQAMKKAMEVQGKVAAGDFAQLARQYSEHADSAAKGGDLGVLPAGQLLPEVAAAVTNLPAGAVVGPVKTAQGLHFLRVTERKAAAVPTLAEVRDALVAALRQQKAAELQQAYLAELGRGTTVNVNQVELGKLRTALK